MKIKIAVIWSVGLFFLFLSACGTLEVGVEETSADNGTATAEVESPTPTITTSDETPSTFVTVGPDDNSSAEPTPAATESIAEPQQDSGTNPPGWQIYRNDEFGIELLHPPGTYIEEMEPSSPEFWSVDIPEGITEEQLFSAVVFQEGGGESDSPSRQAILEIKLVANPEATSVIEMADLFSRRCPGALLESLEATTISVHLMGYRYTCEGMMTFTELWAQYGDRSDVIFGAAWAEMFSPLSENILSTVVFSP